MAKEAPVPKFNYTRGAVFALGGPIVGIVAWLILWHWGFIASIATFAMAWLTVWLYGKGAGGVDRQSLYVILPYIVVGLLLSILSGMVYDGVQYIMDEAGESVSWWTVVTNGAFWSFMADNLLHNGALWTEYSTDILIALALGGLGVYSTVRDVMLRGSVKAS